LDGAYSKTSALQSEIRKIASNIKNYVTSLSSLGGIRDNEVKAILTSYLSIISHLMQNNVSKVKNSELKIFFL